MRILMTADTLGGVWTYAMELARALAPHTVLLATMGRLPTPDQEREAAAASNVELHTSAFKLEWMDEPWDDVLRAGDWLLALEEKFSPDVVHLNGYAHAALPWQKKPIVIGHSCVLSWWRGALGEEAPASWARYRAAVTDGLHAARAVVAPTRTMLESLDYYYGPLPSPSVIFNARTASLFPRKPKQPRVLSAGRLWDRAKNIATLDRAAGEIAWPVCVAGEQESPYGQYAAPKHLRVLGRLSSIELARELGAASVYALPARYEPFGLSALEAALAGCALVLGDIPSLRELWSDAAVFVPPDDARSLSAGVNALIHHPRYRAEMAGRARSRALGYAPHRMARQYQRLYGETPPRAAAPAWQPRRSFSRAGK